MKESINVSETHLKLKEELKQLCLGYDIPVNMRPSLSIRGLRKAYAQFRPGDNEIVIGKDFLKEHSQKKHSWNGVLAVLKHEFAHFLQSIKGPIKGRYSEAWAIKFAVSTHFSVMTPYKEHNQKLLDEWTN